MKETQLHVAAYSSDIFTAKKKMSLDERIEDFLKRAPDGLDIEEPLKRPKPSSPIAILTPEELTVCELTNMDPTVLAQFVKDEKEGKISKLILASYQDAE